MTDRELLFKLKDRLKHSPSNYQVASDLFEMARIMEEQDLALARQTNQYLRDMIPYQIRDDTNTVEKQVNFYRLNKKCLFFDAHRDFDAFLQYLEYERNPEKRFYLPRRKALYPIVQAFQELHEEKYDLLTVSQPKRTGKTTLGLLFVLFRAGNAPDGSSFCTGTGAPLAKSFYNGCLQVLLSPQEYLYYDIFPHAKLVSTNSDENAINLAEKSRFATITCKSIDAKFVGSTEATAQGVLYLDDLVDGEKEAINPNTLDRIWDTVTGDVIGRALEWVPIVIQGTRYSVNDPIGRAQIKYKEMGKRVKVIEIPALDPITDESNFEFIREGRPTFTTEFFRSQRILVSPTQWASQFQQEPYEAKGRLFPEDDLNRYFELPVENDPDAIIAACDTAEGGGDSVCMPVGCIYGEDVFIHDVVFDNSTPAVTKPQCVNTIIRNKVSTATFESNNAGEYYARDVEEGLKEQGYRASIRTKRAISNKNTRIENASDGILKHFYFKDRSLYSPQSQYGQFIRELTTYTRTGKNAHDDAPDALALLENVIREQLGVNIRIFQRPI